MKIWYFPFEGQTISGGAIASFVLLSLATVILSVILITVTCTCIWLWKRHQGHGDYQHIDRDQRGEGLRDVA